MDAIRVQVIAQHTLWPARDSGLQPLDELPSKVANLPALEQTRVYVGFTRVGRAEKGFAATLRHDLTWAWVDVNWAGRAMAERRRRGTSVFLLEAWVPLRRAGSLVFFGPARHPCAQTWCWVANAAQLGQELTVLDIRAPVSDIERRLYDRDSNRFLYAPDDPRAWKAGPWSDLWTKEEKGPRKSRKAADAKPERAVEAASDTLPGGADLLMGASA